MIKKAPYSNPADGKVDYLKRHQEYNMVYNTAYGKRVIDDLLYYAAIDRTAFCAKADNQTFFNLGKQSMGYHIMNALHEEPSTPQTTTIKGEDNE